MKAPSQPADEALRLRTLRQYYLLDTLPEQALDDLAALASNICEAPIALISLVDEHRQWFKSKVGLSASETSRDISFCGHAILQRDLFIVPDATKDERFADNPLVTGDPNIRFYAGAPLLTPTGHALGALCIMDHVPRQLKPSQQEALRVLSKQVMAQLELRQQLPKLVENETRLRLALNAAHMGTFDWDIPNNRIRWNHVDEEPEQQKPENFDGSFEDFGKIIHPVDLPRINEEMTKCIAAKRPFRSEFRVHQSNGGVRWVEGHGEFTFDVDGKPLRMHGVTFEVTKRKQAESALHESNERYHALADYSIQGIALIQDRQIVYVNPAFCEITGYSKEEIIGRTFDEILGSVHPDDKAAAIERQKRFEQGELIDEVNELRLCRKDGNWRWIRATTRSFKLRGKPIRLGMIVDITQRKEAEAALREREQQLRLYVEHSPAAIAMFDRDMKYLVASRRWADDYNLVNRDVIGHSHYELFTELPDRWKQVHNRCLAGAVEKCDEDSFVSDDGRTYWLRWEVRPWHRADNSIGGIMIFSEDITERKMATEALRASEERFRRAVEEAPFPILIHAEDGEVLAVSRAWIELSGYSREELKTIAAWTEKAYGAEMARVQADISSLYDLQERKAEGEYEIICRDGSKRIWDFSSIALGRLPDGRRTAISIAADVTRRKQIEGDLRISEERFRLFMDNSPTIAWVKDEQGRHLYLSKSFEQRFHVRMEDWQGKTDAELWPAQSAEQFRKNDEYVLSSNRSIVVTEETINDDGTPCYWLNSKFPFSDAEGRRFVAGIGLDISEHKKAEARIEHLNRVYAVLSDINQAIVREKDAGLMLAEACRISIEKGRFCLAWIGLLDPSTRSLQIRAHAGADDETLRILSNVISGERPDCAFTFHALKAGEHGVCNDIARDPRCAIWCTPALERNYRAMASLPLKTAGKVVGTFNLYGDEPGFFDEEELRLLDELAMDISFALEVQEREKLRLQVENALRDSEERFRQLAENIQEVFWMTDPAKDQMLYISPAYEKIWGRTCASLYESPLTWLEAIHPDDKERISHSAHNRQITGEYDETYRIQRPDGTVRWIHDRAFPIRDAEGKILRIVGTAEDITARRQLEEQFRQSQKMEAIGQLAGGVAHDFNNILAAIMMQADLASTGMDIPEETQEFLHDIKAAAERAANLTRQLLAFSRRQVMQPRPLDLNEIVTNLTKMLQRILGEDIRLQLNLHSRPLTTRADAGMLDQVLLNLVVNARDAMPDGGRLVIETGEKVFTKEEVATIPDASPGHYVCMSVTDTGCGITPENMSRLFEPFFTTKAPGKGTGLGLATVFGIIKQHGGSITVESKVGKGTKFQIFLPVVGTEDQTADEPKTKPAARGGTETILLVEDEPSVRMLTRTVLERAGYRVLEAIHGVEALRIWEQYRDTVQLLFTDIVMPEGIGGRELATRMQADKPGLRVIFTSGYSADIAGRELSLQEGQNFIQKPSSPHELLETVRHCLDS